MDKTNAILEQVRELFDSQNLGVLATHRDGQPYTSLVAFYANRNLKYLYLVTPNTTRKYENLKSDPRVSIMVNSSINQETDFHQALAVTVLGEAAEITGSQKAEVLSHYLAKHPYLEDFAHAPTCALIGISVKSYFLVQNFQNVMELHLTDEMDHFHTGTRA